ncbi:hypothetical protein CASFOL_009540 [Castilleja foliolosa]|uniref:Uncharacterized protein n=1 Tax=Castilleja foliolosa TaxID=1961234 RepID=A0ABD3DWF0_9LAMI
MENWLQLGLGDLGSSGHGPSNSGTGSGPGWEPPKELELFPQDPGEKENRPGDQRVEGSNRGPYESVLDYESARAETILEIKKEIQSIFESQNRGERLDSIDYDYMAKSIWLGKRESTVYRSYLRGVLNELKQRRADSPKYLNMIKRT